MISAALVMSVLIAIEPVRVERWSSDQALVGELVSYGPQGIGLRQADAVLPVNIAWYDFRAFAPTDPAIEAYHEQAIAAWRARSRRLRGDLAGALPIYRSLERTYVWFVGPQSEDVCLGLAQCLIDAGRREEAVVPAVAWFVAAEAHAPGVAIIEPTIDTQTLLPTALPPVFLLTRGSGMLGELPDTPVIPARERLLYAYYAMAQGKDIADVDQLEIIEQLKRTLRSRDAGTILMEQMVFAQSHPDVSKRLASRDALSRRTRTQRDTWIEVWARLGLGNALILDDDPSMRERGVIELLHVITRLARIEPGLTMLAAEIANSHLESTGRADWGQQILQDARTQLTHQTAAASAFAQESLDDD